MDYAIETYNLTKEFVKTRGLLDLLHPLRKTKTNALTDVSFNVRKGELFGILGPNGAGKTTLIKLLCTLILPTSGEAYVNGFDVIKEEAEAKASLGLITGDERSFYWRLTGRQNLEFFAALNNLSNSRDRINELLDLVGLINYADSKFYTYSAGMKQKLAIARGLLNDPEILFMDEPTRSLDPNAAQNLRDFIKEQLLKNQDKTVFLSTHNLNEAEHLCDRIAIIDRGTIKASGTLNDLKNTIKKENIYSITYKLNDGSKNIFDKLKNLDGIIDFSINAESDDFLLEIRISNKEVVLPQIIEIIVNEGGEIMVCNTKEMILDEVFAELLKNKRNYA